MNDELTLQSEQKTRRRSKLLCLSLKQCLYCIIFTFTRIATGRLTSRSNQQPTRSLGSRLPCEFIWEASHAATVNNAAFCVANFRPDFHERQRIFNDRKLRPFEEKLQVCITLWKYECLVDSLHITNRSHHTSEVYFAYMYLWLRVGLFGPTPSRWSLSDMNVQDIWISGVWS